MDTQDKTLLQTFEGVEIWVSKIDGKFYATVNGVSTKRAKLSELKSMLRELVRTPVQVMQVPYNLGGVNLYEVNRVEGTHFGNLIFRTPGGSTVYSDSLSASGGRVSYVFFRDEVVYNELKGLLAESRELQDRWEAALKKLKYVTVDKLKARQNEVEPTDED